MDQLGIVLERDGTFYRADSGRPHFEQEFADMETAWRFCEGVVQEHPHVECDVFEGKRLVRQHFDAEWRIQEAERTRRAFAKQRRRDRLIIASLVGIVVLVVIRVFIRWML